MKSVLYFSVSLLTLIGLAGCASSSSKEITYQGGQVSKERAKSRMVSHKTSTKNQWRSTRQGLNYEPYNLEEEKFSKKHLQNNTPILFGN